MQPVGGCDGAEAGVSVGFSGLCWVSSRYLVPFGCRTGAARDEVGEPGGVVPGERVAQKQNPPRTHRIRKTQQENMDKVKNEGERQGWLCWVRLRCPSRPGLGDGSGLSSAEEGSVCCPFPCKRAIFAPPFLSRSFPRAFAAFAPGEGGDWALPGCGAPIPGDSPRHVAAASRRCPRGQSPPRRAHGHGDRA